MPSLPALRHRIRQKLQYLNASVNEVELARICQLIAGVSSDPRALELRLAAKPEGLALVDTLLSPRHNYLYLGAELTRLTLSVLA
jgi:hypothetical protein